MFMELAGVVNARSSVAARAAARVWSLS